MNQGPFDFSAPGGGVMAALLLLGLVLYFLLAERLLRQFLGGEPEGVAGLRRAGVIRALIALAPLLGLLGTVCGIIATFQGLPAGPASREVAGGIYGALYTTEYGLVLAIPAFLLERLLRAGKRGAETEAVQA